MNYSLLLGLVLSVIASVTLAADTLVPIEKPQPEYPPLDRRWQHEGAAVLSYQIEKDGTVGPIEILTSSDWPTLDTAAIDAVKQWRFQPIDEPVTKNVRLTFKMKYESEYLLNTLIQAWITLTSTQAIQQAALAECGKNGVDLSSPLQEHQLFDKAALDKKSALEKAVFYGPNDDKEKEMYQRVLSVRAERFTRNQISSANPQEYCKTRGDHLRLAETSFTSIYPAYAQALAALPSED